MAISPVHNAASGMSWLPPQASPVRASTGWTPPRPPSTPAVSATTSDAGSALRQGSQAAAKNAFLFGLKIAFSDSDRLGAARRYLSFSQGLSDSDLRADATLESLKSLAQSIVARTQYRPSAFISTFG
jgi:hypothetical protein